jgi:hypothetical protein
MIPGASFSGGSLRPQLHILKERRDRFGVLFRAGYDIRRPSEDRLQPILGP